MIQRLPEDDLEAEHVGVLLGLVCAIAVCIDTLIGAVARSQRKRRDCGMAIEKQ